jgi:hypothetical protein
MEESLLYVSLSLLASPEADGFKAIVVTSQSRNATLNITGFLVFTGSRFAQYLEGETTALDALMQSINRDPRHKNVVVIYRKPIQRRNFESWSLAYAGVSTYVAGYVERLLLQPRDGLELNRIEQFTRMAREFLRDVSPKPGVDR